MEERKGYGRNESEQTEAREGVPGLAGLAGGWNRGLGVWGGREADNGGLNGWADGSEGGEASERMREERGEEEMGWSARRKGWNWQVFPWPALALCTLHWAVLVSECAVPWWAGVRSVVRAGGARAERGKDPGSFWWWVACRGCVPAKCKCEICGTQAPEIVRAGVMLLAKREDRGREET